VWVVSQHEGKRVFENRVLGRIFGPNKYEERGDWRKLHEELHNLYSSSNIITTFKSRRMRWAGHVAFMRQKCIHSFGKKS
jgi:hypothetical protein